ncbi:MAG: DUF1801 domain-containing protein [Caulobacter sp.]|nr:DUF1801 domain-containing protein [Caulobacter sp.]
MRNAAAPAATVEAYLAALPPVQRAALEHLRAVILSAAPGAAEGISYGIPTFKVGGKAVGHMAAAARRLSFHPGAVIEAFAAELAGFATSKGTVRFQPDSPIPDDLVRRIVRFNIDRQGVG